MPAAAPPASPPPDPPSRADDDLDDILARLGAESTRQPDAPTADEAPGPRPKTRKIRDELTDPRDLERPSSRSGIVVEVGAGLEFQPSFASFGQRAVGAIVDTFVITLAVLPAFVLLQLGDSVAIGFLAIVYGLLGVLAVIALGARSLAKNGKWIGNRIAGTTVVDAINGSFVDSGRAALRMFARHLISPILLFGFLMAFADPQRRTFQDRLAGTVVIRPAREVWSADDD